MVKKPKARLFIYVTLSVLIVIQHIALMMTGFDASKQRGYFPSEDRNAMPFLEALTAEPKLLAYQIVAVLGLAIFFEIIIFLFRKKH